MFIAGPLAGRQVPAGGAPFSRLGAVATVVSKGDRQRIFAPFWSSSAVALLNLFCERFWARLTLPVHGVPPFARGAVHRRR